MMKILLVEDDKSLVHGLEYALAKEGFAIDKAYTAETGLTKALKERHDLLILDVKLPDGTGFDICRKIRQTLATPVIFLTASDEEYNVVMGLDLGGDDYISKPFRINELISRIHAVLRRFGKSKGDDATLRSGNIILNRKSSRLLKEGTDLLLSATEIRLVDALMRNEGNTVTREKLIEQLWDSNEHFIDSNTLTVYIRRLREKIEDDPGCPMHIETVRGIGYRWQ